MLKRTLCLFLFAALALSALSTVRGQAAASQSVDNPAVSPVARSDGWWTARHDEILERVKAEPDAGLVFVGDSITQNYEKTGPAPNEVFAPAWQEFFAPHKALNLGYSGDQTQHVLWRLQHGEVDGLDPANVVLLIGTNNTASTLEPQTAEQVAEGVEAVIEALHGRLPKAKILVIGILPSAVSTEKSAKDGLVNTVVRAKYGTSAYVGWLDLSSLFVKHGELDAELFYDPKLTPPRPPLHPNTQGQRRMAKAVADALYGSAGR